MSSTPQEPGPLARAGSPASPPTPPGLGDGTSELIEAAPCPEGGSHTETLWWPTSSTSVAAFPASPDDAAHDHTIPSPPGPRAGSSASVRIVPPPPDRPKAKARNGRVPLELPPQQNTLRDSGLAFLQEEGTSALTLGFHAGDGSSDTVATEMPAGEGSSEVPDIPGYDSYVKLGEGGMGVVWKAREVGLGRFVALKMIKGAASRQAIERFKAEARAVARISHENIVTIYQIGEHKGTPYFTLELLEGGNLDDKLGGDPQPPREAARLIATLSRAAHAAHAKDVVHRDLKPPNVMYAADGKPKLTDFGLARLLETQEGDSVSSKMTIDGQIMGTPSYMAPEQASGRLADIGPTTDVYALGAILYEMLTGRPPFKGASPMATVWQVLNEDPLPPSRLVSKIPKDLETIALKCLSKPNNRRYPDALELASDLERHVAGIPIKARPTPAWEKAIKWVGRHRTATALMVVCLVALIGGIGGWMYIRSERAEVAAADRKRERQREEAFRGQIEERFAALARALEAGGGQVRGIKVDFDKPRPDLSNIEARARSVVETLPDGVGEQLQGIRTLLDPGRSAQAAALDSIVLEAFRTRYDQASKLVEDLRDRATELGQQAGARIAAERTASEQRAAAEKAANEQRAATAYQQGQLSNFFQAAEAARFVDADFSGLPEIRRPEAIRAAAVAALKVFDAARDRSDNAWQLGARPKEIDPAEWARVQATHDQMLYVLADGIGRAPDAGSKALEVLDRVSDRAKGTAAYHVRRARLLRRAGDRAGAAREEELVARTPADDADDHEQLGWALYKKADHAGAARAFEAAIQEQPDLIWSRVLVSLCNLQLGKSDPAKLEGAHAYLSSLLADKSITKAGQPWLWLLRAFAATEIGDYRMTAALAQSVNNQPEVAEDLRAQAAEKFEMAARDFAEIVPVLPEGESNLRYVLHLNRGIMRLRQGPGHAREALEDFRAAIAIFPDQYHAYGREAALIDDLIRAASRSGEPSRRVGDRTIPRAEAIELLAATFPGPNPLGQARAAAARQYRRAIELCATGSESVGPDRDAKLSQLYAQLSRLVLGDPALTAAGRESALGLLDEALKRTASVSQRGELLARRAEALLDLGRAPEALAAAEQAVAVQEPKGDMLRVRALLQLDDRPRLIAACNEALGRKGIPDAARAELLHYRGLAQFAANEHEKAAFDFAQALIYAPEDVELLCLHGQALLRSSPKLAVSRFRAAEEHAAKDKQGRGIDPEPACGLALALALSGDADEAAAMARESLRRADVAKLDGQERGRLALNAAKTYALAAATTYGQVERRGRPAIKAFNDYRSEAARLRAQALRAFPPDRRAILQAELDRDPAFRLLKSI